MLEKKLAEARDNQTKKRKRIWGYGVLLACATLLAVAFTYLAVQLDRTRAKLQEVEGSAPQWSGGQTGNPAAPLQDPTTRTLPPTDDASAGADTQSFRRQFMQQLAQYKQEAEPKIDEIRLNSWADERYAELNRLQEQSLEYFAQGEYLLARDALQRARAMIAAATAEYADRLEAAKREARTAFENNQAPEAEKAMRQALQLDPAATEMLALQQRIGVLPRVLDLLRQADVARSENRAAKEAEALQQVLAIDPSRGMVKSRLQKLQAQIKQQRFSDTIQKAHNALHAGDLADAQKQIARAKTLFPSSKEPDSLQKQLQQALLEREFEKETSLGEQARRRDDWPAAEKNFQRARQLKPNNKTAVENHNVAQQVIGVTRRINRTLAEEHRLGDKKILDSVSAYLQEVEPVTGISPGLRKIHGELARKADLYKNEVDVVVVSDNETYIIVRGEGHVGKISRRTIQLRPGRRVFEGTCPGYKSKLVTVDLIPGVPTKPVTVICDEKI